MTNPNKTKGDVAERELVRWLQVNGYPTAVRIRAGWEDDHGDIDGVPGLVIDVKNHRTMRIGEWLDRLDEQMEAAGVTDGVVVVKRRGCTDPGEWYAIRKVRNEF